MGLFGNIGGVFGASGSVFMIIVLAVADHLWGENVFNCPCGDYRILYTSAFLVVPPVVIIIIDTSWRVLFNTCRQCFSQWHGRCKRCCCCSRKTCEMLVRLLIRPVLIAILWLVFSSMEPKFGKCIFKDVPCNCTTEEETEQHGCTPELKAKSALMRVIMAVVCLGLTCGAGLLGLLYIIYRCCVPCVVRCCSCLSCCACKCGKATKYFQRDEDDPETQTELIQCLFTLRLEPKTVLKLQEEKLMSERRLVKMSSQSLKDIRGTIGLGQMEILTNHRKDIRLVRWMLRHGYTPDYVRTIVDKAESLGSIIDTIRSSLDTSDEVSPEDQRLLDAALRHKGLKQQMSCTPSITGNKDDGRWSLPQDFLLVST